MAKITRPPMRSEQDAGNESWLTVTQMQEYMGAGRTKAYELISEGEVRSYKLGRKILVERASIDRYIRANGNIKAARD